MFELNLMQKLVGFSYIAEKMGFNLEIDLSRMTEDECIYRSWITIKLYTSYRTDCLFNNRIKTNQTLESALKFMEDILYDNKGNSRYCGICLSLARYNEAGNTVCCNSENVYSSLCLDCFTAGCGNCGHKGAYKLEKSKPIAMKEGV